VATLDLTNAASGFDMTDPNLVTFASTVSAGPTAWTYLTPAGHRVTVKGTGMTFDAAGRPTGGTATSIEIDVKNDSYPEMRITGISVAAATLDDGPASFWRFLDGNDVILGPESAQGAAYSIFDIVGDGIAARNGAIGGNDIIQIGDRIGHTLGDVSTVGFPAAVDYRGGNDEILGLVTNAVQYVYGDAGTVYGGSRLTGGDDSILFQTTNEYSYAAGDAAQAWSLNGQLATVVGGDDYMTAGYYFQGALAGDVYQQEANTRVEGGDNTINGGNLRELIAGDVHTMKVSLSQVTARVVGGNDTIHGNGGDDLIAGDLLYMTTASGIVTGGDDVIHGGNGNDHISGDAYSVYYSVSTATGGDDVIDGGAGNDKIYGDCTDNNQNNVGVGGNDWLSGGADNDQLYGGGGDDQLDGGAGADYLFGGTGNDTYYVNHSSDWVYEYIDPGVDTVWSSLAGYTLTANVENLRYNGVGNFSGVGNGLANTIAGLSGNDWLDGGAGDDLLIGGAGADALNGGAGIDTASYAAASEGVDARLLGAGYAGDALGDSFSGVENLVGSDFGDVLFGNDQANKLTGGVGADYLEGLGGSDVMIGGAGGDLLVGGLGADVFDFNAAGDSAPGSRDIIRAGIGALAFEGAGVAGGDRIDLSGIDANGSAAGNQAFGFGGTGIGRVSLVNDGSNTLVRCNTDKDAAFELEIVVEDGGVLASAYKALDFVL